MRKVKISLVCILVMFLSLGLIGCGSDKPKGVGEASVISLQDDFGRTIKLQMVPQRIVSLAPAHTEILFALGLGNRVVGVTDFCDYPAEVQQKTRVGGYMDPNLEEIVALDPDLVVADSLNQEVVNQLDKANIQVLALNPKDIKGVMRAIDKIGKATGSEKEAGNLTAKIQQQINNVVEKTKGILPGDKPRVYYEIWNEPLMAAGPGTFIDDLIELSGGTNVAGDSAKEYPEYSMEVLIKKDPQIMIHSYGHGTEAPSGRIVDRPGWQGMSCIRDKRIYSVDANLVTRPGPRIGTALQKLARIIHPELFADQVKGDN